MNSDIPDFCSLCGKMHMINLLELDERPFSNIIWLQGYECKKCGGWETVSIRTAALDDLYLRISRAKTGSTQFQKLMAKAIKKVENLRVDVARDMRHGKSKDSH